MPRRNSRAAPPPSPTPSEEERIFDELPNGPYKDRVKRDLNEMKAHFAIRKAKMEKAAADAKAVVINKTEALIRMMPEHHLNMNFHEYMEMMSKNLNEAGVSGRPSFLQLIDDLEVETRPTIKQIKTAGKKASDNAASIEPATVATTLKKKVIQMPKKKSFVVVPSGIHRNGTKSTGARKSKASCSTRNSSQPIASHSSSMVTPPIKRTVTSAASGRAFTPKFDPRLPITPAQGLRKPHIGEEVFMMSKGGSPLGNELSKECRMPTIMLPIANGTAAIVISSDTALDTLNLNQDIQDNLKILQKNMASIRDRDLHN